MLQLQSNSRSGTGNDFVPSQCQNCSTQESGGHEAIGKCHDCQLQLCTNCVIDHQLTNTFAQHNLTLYNAGGAAMTTNSTNNSSSTPSLYDDSSFDDFSKKLNMKPRKPFEGNINSQQQQMNLLQQMQQQNAQNNSLIQIESEIQKTFKFYMQGIKERRDYLIKELNTIAQYALFSQSKSATGAGDECSDFNNNTCHNPLKAIEFTSNFSAIQTSIRNTFGYLRINQNLIASMSTFNGFQQTPNGLPPAFNSLHHTTPLTISCDNGMTSSGCSSSYSYRGSMGSLTSSSSSSGYKPNAIGMNSLHKTSVTAPQSASGSSSGSSAIHSSLLSLSNNKNYFYSGNSEASPVSTTSGQHSVPIAPLSNEDLFLELLHPHGARSSRSVDLTAHYGSASDITQVGIKSKKDKTEDSSSNNNWSSLLRNNDFCFSGEGQDVDGDVDELDICDLKGQKHLQPQASSPPPGMHRQTLVNNELHNGDFQCVLSPELCLSGDSAAHSSDFSDENSLSAKAANVNNTSRLSNNSTSLALAIRPLLKRSKMIYNCKFGEFGINDGQFTEPSGVSINSDNDIIVADTNSHRIQIFDREGRFKFKFGECGKRDGQLLYPNRVAVVKLTGDIVVTERSPTHQIQIYNKFGMFLRKFGANILQHPRGVCVDSAGRIIVVECKVMRVIIFDLMGNVLHKFNCSKYLEFPNGVCCSHEREEIFISDNRAHCIKVFDYAGHFLRQIGGEGITNYPIGVGINSLGQVLVADNHNNFNLTVFTQDGDLICALESKVKHAQCFDVGLMDDGSIVLASKDYRIYVYKYNNAQVNSNITIATLNNTHSAIDHTDLLGGGDKISESFAKLNQETMSNLNLSNSSSHNFLLNSISNLCGEY